MQVGACVSSSLALQSCTCMRSIFNSLKGGGCREHVRAMAFVEVIVE